MQLPSPPSSPLLNLPTGTLTGFSTSRAADVSGLSGALALSDGGPGASGGGPLDGLAVRTTGASAAAGTTTLYPDLRSFYEEHFNPQLFDARSFPYGPRQKPAPPAAVVPPVQARRDTWPGNTDAAAALTAHEQAFVASHVPGHERLTVAEQRQFLASFHQYLKDNRKDPRLLGLAGELATLLGGGAIHRAAAGQLAKAAQGYAESIVLPGQPEPRERDWNEVAGWLGRAIWHLDMNEAKIRKRIDACMGACTTPQERFECLETFRQVLNQATDAVPNQVRNRAHEILDQYEPQIFPARATLYPPSLSSNPTQQAMQPSPPVVHRGPVEIVRVNDQSYVPIYMAVYNSAINDPAGKAPAFKDFEQTPSGQVLVHCGGARGAKEIYFSVGNGWRALRWLDNYNRQATERQDAVTPMVRSFLVPLDVANRIMRDVGTETAVPETVETKSVDRGAAHNQFGSQDPAVLEAMAANALMGSLVTYGPREVVHDAPSNWGEAVDVGVLRTRYGMPRNNIPGLNLVTSDGGFLNAKDMRPILKTLQNVLDTRDRIVAGLPLEEDAKAEFVAFLRKHVPAAARKSRDEQVLDMVGHRKMRAWFEDLTAWATQCQIVVATQNDFDCLSHPGIVQAPGAEPGTGFYPVAPPPQLTSGRVLKGHRQMAAEARQLIGQSFQVSVMTDDSLNRLKALRIEGYDRVHKRPLVDGAALQGASREASLIQRQVQDPRFVSRELEHLRSQNVESLLARSQAVQATVARLEAQLAEAREAREAHEAGEGQPQA